ncbi:MAG: DNA polymerase III subunit gamma/tau, partial [Deltaproteobacteria bacterium]|nr:DNA polymerase III subunit gamma/tau [Deltaproteobacteria bacterium]
ISQGISVDVMEIDAASNRGIEHIRELREGVKFSPAKCRYKTYIIDEVHMLTTESFNALLKTLEEPPSHVKFILATTDQYKVPTTVISRCQRYDFTNISSRDMVDYLKVVVKNEKIKISDASLYLIARASMGGMRDALTSLDMLVSYLGNDIKDKDVVQGLGLNDTREVDFMLGFIIDKELYKALEVFQKLYQSGRTPQHIITDLMGAVKNLSLLVSLDQQQVGWHQYLPDQLEFYQELKGKTTLSILQQYFQLLLELETQVKKSSQAFLCMEMGLIKLCSVESLAGVAEVISALREIGGEKKKSPALRIS